MNLPKGFEPTKGDEFWSKAARDIAQVLVVIGGYDRKELLDRLIHRVTMKNHKIQEHDVLEIADEMYKEGKSK